MGIVIADEVDIPQLCERLEQRGWTPVTIDGAPAYEKVVEPWVWFVKFSPRVEFISWVPDDEQAHRHAEGLRKLRQEVMELAEELGFQLIDSLTLFFR